MSSLKKRHLQTDIRVAYALPPYNTFSNTAAFDHYFVADCIAFWGEHLWKKATKIELNKSGRVA